jgi:hypothetical protein
MNDMSVNFRQPRDSWQRRPDRDGNNSRAFIGIGPDGKPNGKELTRLKKLFHLPDEGLMAKMARREAGAFPKGQPPKSKEEVKLDAIKNFLAHSGVTNVDEVTESTTLADLGFQRFGAEEIRELKVRLRWEYVDLRHGFDTDRSEDYRRVDDHFNENPLVRVGDLMNLLDTSYLENSRMRYMGIEGS